MASFVKRFGLTQTRSTTSSNESPISDNIEKTDATAHTTATNVRTQDELEANAQLRKIRSKHQWDPNLPDSLLDGIDETTEQHDAKAEFGIIEEVVEDSPYPEVLAVAKNVSLSCMLASIAFLLTLDISTMKTYP